MARAAVLARGADHPQNKRATGDTWRSLRGGLGQLAAIESTGPDSTNH